MSAEDSPDGPHPPESLEARESWKSKLSDPLSAEQQAFELDSATSKQRSGIYFVKRLHWLLAGFIVLYLVLHALPYVHDAFCWFTEECAPPAECLGCTTGTERGGAHCANAMALPLDLRGCDFAWQQFAEVDAFGQVRFMRISEIDWYIGADKAKRVMQQVGERSEAIDDRRRSLRTVSIRMRDRVDSPLTRAFHTALQTGDFPAAYDQLDEIRRSFAAETIETLFKNVDLDQSAEDIVFIERSIRAQVVELRDLDPPLHSFFFWTSPNLSILEVLFWALFGVLTNLLRNSAEHIRNNTFRWEEKWVAWTKLAYGPILSAVVVIAMMNGFFQVEGYGIRVWTLPLVGFIFGYASRRTALLFDRIVERFLGSATAGVDAGPEKARKMRQRIVGELMEVYRPPTVDDLRDTAKEIGAAVLADRIERKQQEQP